MSCGTCKNKCKKGMLLCPFSFGLALALTSGAAVFVCLWWMMSSNMSLASMPMIMSHFPNGKLSLSGIALYAFYISIKAFIFGLIFALLYDLIRCCCKGMCCRKTGKICQCQGPEMGECHEESCECKKAGGKCKCGPSVKSNKPEVK